MHSVDDCPITDCLTHETCSWCTELVLDSSLIDTDEGRLCRLCLKDYRSLCIRTNSFPRRY